MKLTPDIPDIPDIPDMPDIPDIPDMPDMPVSPDWVEQWKLSQQPIGPVQEGFSQSIESSMVVAICYFERYVVHKGV